jgi:hypothetical protein
MPWCEQCRRYWTPTSMATDGSCPTCSRVIAAPQRAPWHFKLLVVATALYLAFRLAQGIAWLAHHA